MTFRRNNWKRTESLAAITTVIRLHVPVAVSSSPKLGKPLPLTEPKEEDLLDTAARASYVLLIQSVRIAFSKLSNAMLLRNLYDTDFGQLPDSKEMEKGDILFRNVYLVLTESP